MKEAEIKCVSLRLTIEDLGLTMIRGQVEYVEESRAKESRDLKCLQRAGGVIVRFIRRSVLRRPPLPAHVEDTPALPPEKPAMVLPPHPEPTLPVTVEVDYDKLAEKVSARVTQDLRKVLEDARIQRQTMPVSLPQDAPTKPVEKEDREERMFIPEVEMGDHKGSISVEEGEGEAGTVDDAIAALRQARKKRGDP